MSVRPLSTNDAADADTPAMAATSRSLTGEGRPGRDTATWSHPDDAESLCLAPRQEPTCRCTPRPSLLELNMPWGRTFVGLRRSPEGGRGGVALMGIILTAIATPRRSEILRASAGAATPRRRRTDRFADL